jgi:ERCC4-type nuclease
MLGRFKFSNAEMKTILSSLIIIVDSREQENQPITEYLIKKKIPFKKQKLDFADYSFFVPANPELCIPRDIYFTDNIVIERKNSLNELSGNLTADGGTRFEQELIRSQGAKFYLMVENASYESIINHQYDTQYEPKSFIARLKTFESRYGISVNFVSSKCSGNFIYHTFYYWLREQLKQGNELLCQSET